ncbi:hypothetical protein E3N88_17841 [Mikania micrantha]|uniref:X8 domain-containing protein n=1 Tax=Mikania micrantha TaxID=192012 RepID=A0A5N6NV75_9ASTR|nr:hypothetical protein E3N88_17841 [Mikania micrantha]
MAKRPSSKRLYFVFFLLLVLLLCHPVTCSEVPHTNDFMVTWEKEQLFPSIHRTLMEYFRYKLTEFDSIDPPTTALPSAPITNPVTTSPINAAPGIITVPGLNPSTNPVNPPAPVTNPITTPSTNPPATTDGHGPSWCIAKNGASQAALQSALDYACGIGGADCATIQQGSSCYEPVTLQNHASYAFNSYYQRNPAPTSCDFEGVAAVTTTNPSTGSCVYPSSSTSSATTPISQVPVNPTSLPTAPSSSGSNFPGTLSSPGFSFGNPDPTGLGGFGASPPLVSMASVVSNSLVVVGASIVMFFLFAC